MLIEQTRIINKKFIELVRKETVLVIAWVLAIISAFFVKPNIKYIDYIDFRTLGILWSLMVIMEGLSCNGLFEKIGYKLLKKTKNVWQLSITLVFICFFSSMLITNDVALITFVPFTMMILGKCEKQNLLIPIIVLQTIAANLGSMLTPIGNPQNLYLYGLWGVNIFTFIKTILPYSIVSFFLLLLFLFFIKDKKSKIVVDGKENDIIQYKGNLFFYVILFVIALGTVFKLIPYYILIFLVFIVVFFIQRNVLYKIDYALLFTFIGFFIFTGNIGSLPMANKYLASIVIGNEIGIGVLASQVISNVPSALLLSGFTTNYKGLLIGVNVGGLGTLIASMASLISYKLYAHNNNSTKGKYLLYFTVVNIVFLVVLLILNTIIN